MRTRAIAFAVALFSLLSVGGAPLADAHEWTKHKREYIDSHRYEERVGCKHHDHPCTRWAMRRHLTAQARTSFRARKQWLRVHKPTRFYSHHGTVAGAIVRAFPDGSEDKAKAVARCESEFDIYARSSSGRYLGLFQMGPEERERFGFAYNKWTQARAAFRYWQISGWSPWPVCGD